jgi:hypothetical protein
VLAWPILYREELLFFRSEDSAISRSEIPLIFKLRTESIFRRRWGKVTDFALGWLRYLLLDLSACFSWLKCYCFSGLKGCDDQMIDDCRMTIVEVTTSDGL